MVRMHGSSAVRKTLITEFIQAFSFEAYDVLAIFAAVFAHLSSDPC
jgi:hypothetical protein